MTVIRLSEDVSDRGLRLLGAIMMLSLLCWLPACSSTPKAKLRTPLAVGPGAPPAGLKLTEQGTQAHLAGNYEQARTYCEQAVSLAPSSAEAHYNLGLSLFARGDTERAREQFIEAANLAPGDKVIWDSPALRPSDPPKGRLPRRRRKSPTRPKGRRLVAAVEPTRLLPTHSGCSAFNYIAFSNTER